MKRPKVKSNRELMKEICDCLIESTTEKQWFFVMFLGILSAISVGINYIVYLVLHMETL